MARKTTFKSSTQLTTSMADLGGIVRFDLINNNTFSFSFVLDKTLQLIETPIADPIVHSFASSLLSYTFEVFHNNLVSVKIRNNVLAYVVVNPSHPTSFSSAYLPKKTLGGKSAFTLKLGTQIFKFPLDLLDFSRIVKLAVRSDSKVVYSEVDAQNIVLRTNVLLSGINLFGECEQEETSAFFIHPKKAFANFPTEIFFVAVRDIEHELLTLLECSDNKSISFQVGTSWEVISDRSSFYNWFTFSLLDHPTSLSHTGNCYLGREFKSCPDSSIDFIMQFEVLSDFILPSVIDTELQSFGVSLNSPNYFRTGRDFNFCSDIRSHNNMEEEQVYKSFGGTGFLPRINSGVSALTIL